MRIKSNRIIIRYFERKDSEKLYRIVREKNILRFIKSITILGGINFE